jgi:UDP-N-acetylmuramyl pentapeptide phosphotransferase/UDP-N-acetylglucosamine-1-phosphate transferase
MNDLSVRNYRGREVPAVLGFALAAGGAVSALLLSAFEGVTTVGVVSSGAALLVFAAGLVDDFAGEGPRGVRGHLRALAAGRVSTGIVKLFVLASVSIVTVASLPGREGAIRVAGVVLLAGAANLWNGLDVRPGRAIKFALLVPAAILAYPWRLAPFVPGVWLGAVIVLPWDVRERGVLGDSGANALGFSVGVACYLALSNVGVLVAAVAALALNVLAETLTLSRLIDEVRPLRWFDRIARAPEP